MATTEDLPISASVDLLTLRQAADLVGIPKRDLRERVQHGEVAVRLVGAGRAAKLRLTHDALADAGLLPGPDAEHATLSAGSLAPLVSLVREQHDRITAIEEQRFQLAGQLGAALERIRTLEARLPTLAEGGVMAREAGPSAIAAGRGSSAPEETAHDDRRGEATGGHAGDRRDRSARRPPSTRSSTRAMAGVSTGLTGAAVAGVVALLSRRGTRRVSRRLVSLLPPRGLIARR